MYISWHLTVLPVLFQMLSVSFLKILGRFYHWNKSMCVQLSCLITLFVPFLFTFLPSAATLYNFRVHKCLFLNRQQCTCDPRWHCRSILPPLYRRWTPLQQHSKLFWSIWSSKLLLHRYLFLRPIYQRALDIWQQFGHTAEVSYPTSTRYDSCRKASTTDPIFHRQCQ